MFSTQIIHHVSKDFTHEVIEVRTTFLGLILISSEIIGSKQL